MKKKENLLSDAVKGGIAGVPGTIVLTAAVKLGPTLLRQMGIDAPEPPAKAKQNEPPKKLAQKIAKGAFDTKLNKQEQEAAAQALHWGYGVGWGVYYGVMQHILHLPFVVHGTLLGGVMTTAALVLVPAMGIAPPAEKVPTNQKVMQAFFIMLYSWTTALVYRLLSRE
ncbi:MAG: DUF1440 domain-containing protein [Chloroflexota bacterium]